MVGTFLTLKQTLSTLTKIYGKIENGSIGDVEKRDLALYQAKGSLVRLLSTFIIEPTIVVSKNLKEEEIIEKLAETNVEIFSSFYLQAFNVLTGVYGFEGSTAFDILSSKGGMLTPKAARQKVDLFGMEEMSILPIKNKTMDYISLEAAPGRVEKTIKTGFKDPKITSLPTMIQKEMEITQKLAMTDNNGKAIDMTVTIPVLIKATVIYSEFSNIETMISTNDRNKGFSSRLDEYRSGMISIGDLIFADDLIKEYKSNKLKDKDGLIDFMESRSTNANKKLITKGYVGLSKFYSCLIVSKNQMQIIEQKLGGSISKERYKEMLMNQTKSLLINVVDTDWERVQIHTKDLKGTSDLSFKVIKNKKGGTDSSDLVDIFKSVMANKPPVF